MSIWYLKKTGLKSNAVCEYQRTNSDMIRELTINTIKPNVLEIQTALLYRLIFNRGKRSYIHNGSRESLKFLVTNEGLFKELFKKQIRSRQLYKWNKFKSNVFMYLLHNVSCDFIGWNMFTIISHSNFFFDLCLFIVINTTTLFHVEDIIYSILCKDKCIQYKLLNITLNLRYTQLLQMLCTNIDYSNCLSCSQALLKMCRILKTF